jgi:hypothetical protein
MLLCAGSAIAQRAEEYSPAIEDNSFLIEEAYNQERRVVQHIMNLEYQRGPDRGYAFSFTQEWPLGGEDHQLSFTLPYRIALAGAPAGVGDVLLNYRYQLFKKEEWAAVAPRISISLPTGDSGEGQAYGTPGLQISFPASKRLADPIVGHLNLGAAVWPRAKGMTESGQETRRTLTSYWGGGSLIWLAARHFNVMLEWITTSSEDFDEQGNGVRSVETVINPGFRFALEAGPLEIVPGVGVPFRFRDQVITAGAFLYLSFEHPF